MSYIVYIKDNIGNMIGGIDQNLPKQFTTGTLQITDGLLKKSNYLIPVEHILFIEEI